MLPTIIKEFIEEEHIMSVVFVSDERFFPFHCFFVFDDESTLFLFKSAPSSDHAQRLTMPVKASGLIDNHADTVAFIQGVQILGTIFPYSNDPPGLSELYRRRFSFGDQFPGNYYCLKPDWMKYTDNRSVFGQKVVWERDKF